MVSKFSLKVRPSSLLVVFVVCLTLFISTSSVALAAGQAKGFNPAKSYAFTVNTTSDTHDKKPGDGKCADSKSKCSLRAATEEADALPQGSRITIVVPAGTYGLTLGTLQLTANTITINGAGNTTTIIKGNHTFTIMYIAANVSASLNRLTIEGGSATNGNGSYGGGIWNQGGTLSVKNSTVSDNTGDSGGGIFNDNSYGSTATLTGTIVVNNLKGQNCYGTISEGAGYNLDSGSSCGFNLSSDLNNMNPKLGPLADNGGPIQTMALLQGSPAIDWVALSSCPATDQRGYMRPDNHESTCDIGAYESAY